MSEQLYPKEPQPLPSHPERPWGIRFELFYDDGPGVWTKYYRTKVGARISAWWHYNIASWGGSVTLFDNRSPNAG